MSALAILGGPPVRTSPFPRWPVAGDRERELLGRVLDSGNWDSRHGIFVQEFEEKFSAYQGAGHGICVTNGEAALRVPLEALELEPGDEVIVPAYTFVASATAVLQAGLVPVFADVDGDGLGLDAASVRAAIGPRTRVIMPVHIGGVPAEMDALSAVAEEHGLVLLEDAAQAWGARWRERGVGAIGLAGGFSFHASKNLTSGEGGIVLTDDASLAEACRSLANNGRGAAGERYRHVRAGSNARMSEFHGALLCAGLERYPGELKMRERRAELLRRALDAVPGVAVQRVPAGAAGCSWHLIIVRVDGARFGGAAKGTIVRAIAAEGAPVSSGYETVPYQQPMFAGARPVPFRAGENPVAERLCASEAVWIRHNVLMADDEAVLDIARAFAKVQESGDELRDVV